MEENFGAEQTRTICTRWWFCAIIIVVLAVICVTLIGCSKEDSTTEASYENTSYEHIYDNAEIMDLMNGIRTDKLGEYSVVSVPSSEVTEDVLNDWYFNYVEQNDYNWCMILYSDRDDNMGVYACKGTVQKDIYFHQNDYGDYTVGDSSEATLYAPADDGTLVKVLYDEFTAEDFNLAE